MSDLDFVIVFFCWWSDKGVGCTCCGDHILKWSASIESKES